MRSSSMAGLVAPRLIVLTICALLVVWGTGLRTLHHTVLFGSRRLQVELARTPAEHLQGLTGRQKLKVNQGMLFVFATPGKYCFWMKGMQFPLDIVWLSSDKRVVQIAQHLSPATYPTSYCANQPSQYVLEINAGLAQASGVQVGSFVSF